METSWMRNDLLNVTFFRTISIAVSFYLTFRSCECKTNWIYLSQPHSARSTRIRGSWFVWWWMLLDNSHIKDFYSIDFEWAFCGPVMHDVSIVLPTIYETTCGPLSPAKRESNHLNPMEAAICPFCLSNWSTRHTKHIEETPRDRDNNM